MRYYTDTQAPREFIDLLRGLQWDIRTVYEEGTQNEKNDFMHVRKANELGRIFLTFDRLKGESGVKVAQEIATNGGRVIKISAGPQQSPFRSVGKLLFHYPIWEPFFRENEHGFVDISDIRRDAKLLLPHENLQRVDPTGAPQFIGYLEAREQQKLNKKPPTRPITPQPDQFPLAMDDPNTLGVS